LLARCLWWQQGRQIEEGTARGPVTSPRYAILRMEGWSFETPALLAVFPAVSFPSALRGDGKQLALPSKPSGPPGLSFCCHTSCSDCQGSPCGPAKTVGGQTPSMDTGTGWLFLSSVPTSSPHTLIWAPPCEAPQQRSHCHGCC
jgi:hypothetical protein